MYCRKCGKEMRNTSRFCPYCGCKVPEGTEPGSGQAEHIAAGKGKRQKESGEKYSLKLFSSKIMIVFLVIIVIAGFGGGRLFGKYQKVLRMKNEILWKRKKTAWKRKSSFLKKAMREF